MVTYSRSTANPAPSNSATMAIALQIRRWPPPTSFPFGLSIIYSSHCMLEPKWMVPRRVAARRQCFDAGQHAVCSSSLGRLITTQPSRKLDSVDTRISVTVVPESIPGARVVRWVRCQALRQSMPRCQPRLVCCQESPSPLLYHVAIGSTGRHTLDLLL